MTAIAQPAHAVRLRPIALPSEHGGWGMLGAPIITGLLVAPSFAGVLVGIAGAAAFLTRQPFRLALVDLQKGRWYPRTTWAIRFACLYAALGVIALVTGMAIAGPNLLIPLCVLAVLGAVQFSSDVRGLGRRFLPEVCGAAAMSCLAPAIAIAGGKTALQASLLAIVLTSQSTAAISYAAARVRLARHAEVSRTPTYATHLVGLATVGALVAVGLLRWPIAVAFILLCGRAVWGLSCHRREIRAGLVGAQEVGYALLTVLALVLSQ